MKTFLLAFAALTSLTAATAQADWEPALRSQIATFDSVDTREELVAATAPVERIAAASPDAWLPNYYAAHLNLQQHWAAGEKGCAECLDKVDAFLTAAEGADDNSEVLTLRASYYQAMLQLKPMRAPYYGPKASGLLERAIAADPSNPRAASLMGQNLYYTPSMFGGGADKAVPHLARAVELFEAEAADAERDDLLPTWGVERARAMHGEAIAAVE